MSARLEVTRSGPVVLAGVRRRGRVTDLLADRLDRPGWTGSVHQARVLRWDAGTRTAWLDAGALGQVALPVRKGEPPNATEPAIVQVTTEPREGKPAEVTRDVALPGRFLVHLPYGTAVSVSRTMPSESRTRWRAALEGGWIVRSAANEVETDRVTAEARSLAATWREAVETAFAAEPPTMLLAAPHPGQRLLLDHPDIAEVLVEDEADARALAPSDGGQGLVPQTGPVDLADEWPVYLQREVPLRCGGNVVVETTRALTAVDVNSGSARDPALVNREAAREVAHQLRLRNIGGVIVIDFINLPKAAERRAVLDVLRTATGEDPASVRLGTGFMALGLVELARMRRGRSLAEVVPPGDALPGG